MKVAVTGAAGFLGTNLINQLVDRGHEITAIDRVRSDKSRQEGVTWVQADVLDPEWLVRALDGAEIVYHLVAIITLVQQDDRAWTINTVGVRTVAEAARTVGARRMVHCGSVHSFDQHACEGRLDETSTRSVSPSLPVDDRSKWFGEVELRKVIDAGLDAVICNPTGIYGPVDYGRVSSGGQSRGAPGAVVRFHAQLHQTAAANRGADRHPARFRSGGRSGDGGAVRGAVCRRRQGQGRAGLSPPAGRRNHPGSGGFFVSSGQLDR